MEIRFVKSRDIHKIDALMSQPRYLNATLATLLAVILITALSGPRVVSAGFSNLGWIGFLQNESNGEPNAAWLHHASGVFVRGTPATAFRTAGSLAFNSSAYLGLGYVQARDMDLVPAIQSIENAIRAGRKDPVTYLFLGNLAHQAGDKSLALTAWRSGHAERYFETRAKSALSIGHREVALALYQRAIEINPQTDLAYLGIGQYYYETGHFTQAIEAFEIRARMYQDRIGYSWLGRAAEAQGDLNKAIDAYSRAAELGELWYGYIALGDLYLRQGNLAAAQEWYQRGQVAFPTSLSLKLKLGNVALRQGDRTLAYFYFSDALESAPDHPLCSYYMGVWYYSQRNYEMARSWFEQALGLGLQPDYSLYEVLLDSYLKTGDCKAVRQMTQRTSVDQSLSDQQRLTLMRRATSCVED